MPMLPIHKTLPATLIQGVLIKGACVTMLVSRSPPSIGHVLLPVMDYFAWSVPRTGWELCASCPMTLYGARYTRSFTKSCRCPAVSRCVLLSSFYSLVRCLTSSGAGRRRSGMTRRPSGTPHFCFPTQKGLLQLASPRGIPKDGKGHSQKWKQRATWYGCLQNVPQWRTSTCTSTHHYIHIQSYPKLIRNAP